MIKQWPWFAPVFAAYPPLYVAASNPGQAETSLIAMAAAVAAAGGVAIVMLLRPLLRSWTVAGLGAAWVVLLFFAYGPVNGWWLEFAINRVEQRAPGSGWLFASPQIVQSVLWALLVLLGIAALRRASERIPARLAPGLNVMAIVLGALVAVRAVSNAVETGEPVAARPPPAAVASGTAEAARPDIYLIVLDGYARADVLAKYYGYDNGPFLDGLRRRGFQVSDASHANFAWTFLSLSSALNFEYVQPLLGDRLDPQGRSRKESYRLLRDNRAARFLKERGYRTVHLQSTWGGTGSNPFADEFLPCYAGVFSDEYVRALADVSWLRAFGATATLDVAQCHLKNLETLAGQARVPGPKFVFAHFLPPHHPYLFDRDGRILRHANLSDQFEFQKKLWEDRSSYLDQLLFMNRRIDEVIGRLIAESPRPPVIILMSDHGPNLKENLAIADERRIRLGNMTAMYLPGAPADLLPADATPVNHLRRVFNFYFNAGFPLLPDRYFASTYARPFELVEVGADGEIIPGRRGF